MHIGQEQIIIAFIGAVPVLIGSYLTYLISKKKHELEIKKIDVENKAIKREINTASTALGGFGGMMHAFGEVEHEIRLLCKESPITRVVVLCAWNGKFSPKWTTAVWQYRELDDDGSVRPVSYVHVGLDHDYVNRLEQMKKNRSLLFKTCDAPNSLIKRIYDAEDVTDSLWCFLSAADTQDHDGRLITYMSFATQGGEIDNTTRLKCELLAGRLAPLTGRLEDE
jgi:hypothetical protein